MEAEDLSGDEQSEQTNVVQNLPYDEAVEVSDGEEIPSVTATPRDPQDTPDSSPVPKKEGNLPGQHKNTPLESTSIKRSNKDLHREEESESESEDSEGSEPPIQVAGVYDPNEYSHLPVSKELKELFKHIMRYKPQVVQLDTKLKPFIPEYIPSIGDIDAFLKVILPNEKPETLGLTLVDEPRVKQSDPTLLDLTLRTISKKTTVKPMVVRSIEDPEKQIKEMESWTKNISELHRQKPATNVHYTKNMPDIEYLMQEWPAAFQEAVYSATFLPSSDMECDLTQFTDVVCALMDIPVYKNRIHSLHVFFTLYMEFKNSQHFQNTLDDGGGGGGGGGGALGEGVGGDGDLMSAKI